MDNRVGGMRRKKKRKSNIKLEIKKNKHEIKLVNTIKFINNNMSDLDEDNTDMFMNYIDCITNDFILDIVKGDFVKKSDYLKFRDEPFLFYDKVFILNNKFIGELENYYNYFVKDFVHLLIEYYDRIRETLISKKYREVSETNEEFGELSLSKCYEYFGLKLSDEVDQSTLKRIYRKKALQLHPDKHLDKKEEYEKKFHELTVYYKYILQH